MLALCAWAMVGCSEDSGEPVGPNTPETPVLTVTTPTSMNIGAEGGLLTVEFEVKGAEYGQKVDVKLGSELWLSKDEFSFNFDTDEGSLVLDVDANNGAARSAKVTIVYEDQKAEVSVMQAAKGTDTPLVPDVEFEASVLYLEYYGDEYSDYAYSYYAVLSDNGIDENGLMQPNSTYYILDFYSAVELVSEELQLPTGTYVYDATDGGQPGTMSPYCAYMVTDEEGYASVANEGVYRGEATITDEGIEMLVELTNGEVHKVTYQGEPVGEPIPGGSGGGISNLEGDYTFEYTDAYIAAETYGDEYGLGGNYWYIAIAEDAETYTGDYFSIELVTDSSTTDIVGSYVAYDYYDEAAEYVGSFFPGDYMVDDYGLYPLCTWLMSMTEGELDGEVLAPLMAGEINITKEGDVYTIAFNCEDDMGNAVVGTVSGVADIYVDIEEASVTSKRPLAKPMLKAGRKIAKR